MNEPPSIDPDATAHRVDRLTRLLGLGALALLGVTWKLWTPQDVFPRVPLLYWAPPHWLDWSSIALVVAGFLGLIVHRRVRERRTAAALTACGFALQFLADQHRLQPWAWQFFILALVLALADDRTILVGWRWLVISIYAYSAFSKLDFAFAEQMGGLLLLPLQQTLLWNPRWIPKGSMSAITWVQIYGPFLLPLGEFGVAALLSLRRTRWCGLYASWFMHLGLLALLSPWGLNHSWGVLLWNVVFIFQNWLLFMPGPQCRAALQNEGQFSIGSYPGRGILAIALVIPAFYPFGGCDAWLGWAVYAPPLENVLIQLNDNTARNLPDVLRTSVRFPPTPTLVRVDESSGPVRLDPNHWSLKTLSVPCYPSTRFRTGVALSLLEEGQVARLDLIQFSRSTRWPVRPKRWSEIITQNRRLRTRDEIWNYAGTFWFNAYPECVYRRLAGERGDVSPPGD